MCNRLCVLIRYRLLWLFLTFVVLTACDQSKAQPRNALAVYAAASLTEAFEALARDFEATHPGVPVVTTFAGSQVLRLQIEQGAPADVFASANEVHMTALVESRDVLRPQVFAHNELVVIVPRDNPAAVGSVRDLVRAKRLVVGASTVPVGAYTQKLLQRLAVRIGPDLAAAVRARVVSEESNVRLVRAKVELGEADAAIVYRTDAASSDAVKTIAIPEDFNVRADYYIGQVHRTHHPDLARQWIEHVASARGRATLSRHGFVTAQ